MNHITQMSRDFAELQNPGYAYRRKSNIGFLDFKWEDKKAQVHFNIFFPNINFNFALGFANPFFNCLNICN